MLHAVQRHAFVVLADRVLHIVQGLSGAQLQGQAVALASSPSALLAFALPKFRLPGRATLVLGNPWASVALIRLPTKSAHSQVAETRLAQAHAEQLPSLSADAPTEWRPRKFRLKEHLLVAALPENEIDRITQALAVHRVVASSIQPLWTWLTLARSPRFRANRAWSALVEPGFVTIAHQTRGEPDWLRTLRTDNRGPSLTELLARQAAATGFTAGPVETILFASPPPELTAPWLAQPVGRQFLA